MQIDQFLRRLLWRVRRKMRPGADNEPIFVVEPAPVIRAPRPVARKLRRRDRWLRTALGFIATFALLATGYAFLVAASSRAPLDVNFVAPLDPGGARATSAAAALLSLGLSEPLSAAEAPLIIPNGRRLRAERIEQGAAEAASAYVDILIAAAPRIDPALTDAREALDLGDSGAARDALVRHNSRVARGRAGSGAGPARVARIAEAAAAACEREAAALMEIAQREQGWMASPQAQAMVSHGRGVAFGWLLLLRGALADAPDVASATVVEASIPLDALAAAAEHQPLFLFNGGPDAPWSPQHVRAHAEDLARAADGARSLAKAALRPPTAPD